MKLFMTILLALLGIISLIAALAWLVVILNYGAQFSAILILLAIIISCVLFVLLAIAVANNKVWAPLVTFLLSIAILIISTVLGWMTGDIGGIAIVASGVLFFALAINYYIISRKAPSLITIQQEEDKQL